MTDRFALFFLLLFPHLDGLIGNSTSDQLMTGMGLLFVVDLFVGVVQFTFLQDMFLLITPAKPVSEPSLETFAFSIFFFFGIDNLGWVAEFNGPFLIEVGVGGIFLFSAFVHNHPGADLFFGFANVHHHIGVTEGVDVVAIVAKALVMRLRGGESISKMKGAVIWRRYLIGFFHMIQKETFFRSKDGCKKRG